MIFTETPLSGSFIVSLNPIGDSRGWFARTYCKNEFAQIGHDKEWVQINHSFTSLKGTIRGLHFQNNPFSEIKLLRCISGAVYDVIVDLRKNSPTFLKWFGTELSAENKNMLYIPKGFAHGFQSLADNTELIYHHSEFYNSEAESGLMFDDEKLNIKWPLEVANISERDKNHQLLNSTFKGL